MSTRTHFRGRNYWKTQLPVDYVDTSLTINTFETVSSDLSEGAPARLWYIVIEQTNNGASQEDLELEITINGTAYTFLKAADSGTQYFGYISEDLTTGDFTTGMTSTPINVGMPAYSTFDDRSKPFTAESVGLIRVKQTTTVDGTSAQIEVNIVWDKLVENG